MSDSISPQQFHDSDGVEDWRVVAWGVSSHFRTGSFETGVKFVSAIGALADAANHHPDVDLRYGGLTVRLVSHDVGGLSTRDVDLAREISKAARDLDVPADPSAVQDLGIAIDAYAKADVMPFWRAVLGYDPQGDEDLVDPHSRWPGIWFQDMEPRRTERNRIHVDVFVPHDQAEARVQAAVAAGGRVVYDARAPMWWTLADPEGNEVDIATWQGRG